MALSIDSKVGDILANPKGKAILDKHLPSFSTNPKMSMAKGMTLKVIAPMSGWKITPAVLKGIDEDLKNM